MKKDHISGAVAVVTGGASGIGRGIAEALLEKGAQVVVADRDGERLAEVARELGVLGVETDVTSSDSVRALADTTVRTFGSVQILCNNAGVGPRGETSDLTLDDWKWILDVNLWGVIHGMHHFLPFLKQNAEFAHVVNTSSISVVDPPAGLAPYVASKAAVFGLTEVINQELAGTTVGSTILLPGPVSTNISNSLRNRPQGTKSALQDFDLQKKRPDWAFMDPREVGDLVLQAISDNQLYLITHERFRPQILGRHSQIVAGISSADVMQPSGVNVTN